LDKKCKCHDKNKTEKVKIKKGNGKVFWRCVELPQCGMLEPPGKPKLPRTNKKPKQCAKDAIKKNHKATCDIYPTDKPKELTQTDSACWCPINYKQKVSKLPHRMYENGDEVSKTTEKTWYCVGQKKEPWYCDKYYWCKERKGKVIVVATTLAGFSRSAFTEGPQRSYRKAVAAQVGVDADDDVELSDIRGARRRLRVLTDDDGDQQEGETEQVNFDTLIAVADDAASADAMGAKVKKMNPASLKTRFVAEMQACKRSGDYPDMEKLDVEALQRGIAVGMLEPTLADFDEEPRDGVGTDGASPAQDVGTGETTVPLAALVAAAATVLLGAALLAKRAARRRRAAAATGTAHVDPQHVHRHSRVTGTNPRAAVKTAKRGQFFSSLAFSNPLAHSRHAEAVPTAGVGPGSAGDASKLARAKAISGWTIFSKRQDEATRYIPSQDNPMAVQQRAAAAARNSEEKVGIAASHGKRTAHSTQVSVHRKRQAGDPAPTSAHI
jgi:hypothetical protein